MASIITKIEVRGSLTQSDIYGTTLLNMAASDLPCTSPMALRTRRNTRWHNRVGRRHARGTHRGDRGSIPGHHSAVRRVGRRQDSRHLAALLSVEVLQGRTRAHGNSSFIHVLTYVVDLQPSLQHPDSTSLCGTSRASDWACPSGSCWAGRCAIASRSTAGSEATDRVRSSKVQKAAKSRASLP